MFTLVIVVCITAGLGFFSQELNQLFKKIFSIKGAPLLLPLALGSWVVVVAGNVVIYLLNDVRAHLNKINQFLLNLIPQGQYSEELILIFLLTCLSIIPVIVLNILSYRKSYKPYEHPYLLSTLIWIVSSILLVSVPVLYQ
jgi:hypothetical protein